MVGRQGLTRDALVGAFRAAGADDPVSHLATGNVSFSFPGRTRALQLRVEDAIGEIIGRHEPVFIRTLGALQRGIAAEPFSGLPYDDVCERCVSFADASPEGLLLPMTTPRGDAVVFGAGAREVFSVTRRIDGRVGNPVRLIERALGRRVTTRNWNTVERIVRLHETG